MQTYLNESGAALSVAVYLATDTYDFVPGVVSATALMKPVRQQILRSRVPAANRTGDILNMVKSRLGTSIHDGIEKAWNDVDGRQVALASLGIPKPVIDRIVVNPEGELKPDAIPVYMEKRSFRTIRDRQVSGKFDFVAEDRVEDFKSTGTFTWTKGVKDADYQLQLSIYRWLNPDIIKQDTGAVRFFFTDWAAYKVQSEKGYPTHPVMTKNIPLLTLEETEAYIGNKLDMFDKYKDADETTIPECTDEELWRRPDEWKVYKDPNNLKRCMSGGKFDNSAAASLFNQEKTGGAGFIKHIPGQVGMCKYCDGFEACTQKDRLIADGSLTF